MGHLFSKTHKLYSSNDQILIWKEQLQSKERAMWKSWLHYKVQERINQWISNSNNSQCHNMRNLFRCNNSLATQICKLLPERFNLLKSQFNNSLYPCNSLWSFNNSLFSMFRPLLNLKLTKINSLFKTLKEIMIT